jgi:hypothetical protein
VPNESGREAVGVTISKGRGGGNEAHYGHQFELYFSEILLPRMLSFEERAYKTKGAV